VDDDLELLKGYVCEGSQADFETLVQRYTPMVFSSAQRRVGASSAEDVTQAVFIILARKATRLCRRKHANIAGWLHATTRYASLQVLRSEKRRLAHEHGASEEQDTMQEQPETGTCTMITPLLDTALDSLGAKDRNVLLLRFFKGASHASIGEALGISENAANKRVERALAKLERFFTKRGVSVSTAALVAAIAGEGTATAATGLGASCAATALSWSSAGAVGSVATLVGQTSAAMLVAQMKTAAIAVITCSALVGGTAATVKHVQQDSPSDHALQAEPFALVYKGRTELPDGTFEFQLNDRNSRKTYFVRIGDEVLGYELREHTLKGRSTDLGVGSELHLDVSELTLESPSKRIVLVKDRYVSSGEQEESR